jgi:hypothetical protein
MLRATLFSLLLTTTSIVITVPANADDVLFTFVEDDSYVGPGQELAAFIATLPNFNVTTRVLDEAIYRDYDSFDQIWVYDLSVGANNNAIQAANYSEIANWFNRRAEQNLVADGRILSSSSPYTRRNGMSSEAAWIQNYALQLKSRGGGLVLGTDHASPSQSRGAFVDGINEINAQININPFSGFFGTFPYQAIVDTQSPLYVSGLDTCFASPNHSCINDNSTTSFAPSGEQPNGLFLTPVAYHGTESTAFDNAAVSSTIGSPTFTEEVPEPSTIFSSILACLGFRQLLRRKRS